MDGDKLAQLRELIRRFKSDPSLLLDPSLSFFKDYLESLGARIPPNSFAKGKVKVEEDDIVESDLELDGEIVDPDNEPPQKMGDPTADVSEENRDAAQMSKAKALDAISEGKMDEAINYLTDAVSLNPTSAILYATRASVYVKLNKPNAAIRDADAALKINPDSAKAYKYRGIAKSMLGQWEESARDLHLASGLDHDDEIQSVLKKVEPNVRKIEEHRRKYERLRKEREIRKAEHERQRQRVKPEDPELEDPDSLAALRDGSVLNIDLSRELKIKLAASKKLSRLAILYFTATWCGPCRMMGPVFKSLAEKYRKVVFMKIDIDKAGEIAQQYNVSSVPTFFFLKNEKEVDKVVGADKTAFERKVAQYAA